MGQPESQRFNDASTLLCEGPIRTFCGPRLIQSDCHQSRYCESGFGCIDTEFVAPRYWRFRQHWLDANFTQIVEQDSFLLSDNFYRPLWRYTGNIWQDYRHFYAPRSLSVLGLGVGLHAILANTSLDQDFRDWFQDNAVGDPEAFEWAKALGETWVVVPTALGLWVLDECIDRCGCFDDRGLHQGVGDWARQTSRALLVGAPANYALQRGIGASRPTDTNGDSRWSPFNDNNGSSGHAFVGAVPFLVAAKRTDNLLLKSALVVGSLAPGYSRIYDDDHYLSQVLLGYTVAVLAVEATELTQQSAYQFRLVPLNMRGGFGVGVELRL